MKKLLLSFLVLNALNATEVNLQTLITYPRYIQVTNEGMSVHPEVQKKRVIINYGENGQQLLSLKDRYQITTFRKNDKLTKVQEIIRLEPKEPLAAIVKQFEIDENGKSTRATNCFVDHRGAYGITFRKEYDFECTSFSADQCLKMFSLMQKTSRNEKEKALLVTTLLDSHDQGKNKLSMEKDIEKSLMPELIASEHSTFLKFTGETSRGWPFISLYSTVDFLEKLKKENPISTNSFKRLAGLYQSCNQLLAHNEQVDMLKKNNIPAPVIQVVKPAAKNR